MRRPPARPNVRPSLRRTGLPALLVLAGCGPEHPPALPAPPLHLADTGLYADFVHRELHPEVVTFTPQYPLWSDGATKRRFLRLPPGTAIDASDPEHWVFPVGTRLWKEFAFERRIETRYLERHADGWIRATYVWNVDGTEAVLAPEHGVRLTRPDGVPYDVPGRTDCRLCHDGGAGPVLGFSALQLSPDRDPLAPHAESPRPGDVDLETLVRRRLLRGLPEHHLAEPPRVRGSRSPVERAALGYLHANCSACHNAAGPLADLDFDLSARIAPGAEAPGLRTTVGRPSRFRPAGHDAALRIAPGDPDASVLLLRAGARDPLTRMPPLATHRVDEVALDLLRTWVGSDPALAFDHEPRPRPSNDR